MGMGVGASHELALVLEHLHPAPALAELGHLLRPGVDDGADLRVVVTEAASVVRMLLEADPGLTGLRIADATLEDAIAQLLSAEERIAA